MNSMAQDSDKQCIRLDDAIRMAISEELQAAGSQIERETARCGLYLQMYQAAAKGWRSEWHTSGHPDACRHCRGAAWVGFRNGDPQGLLLLLERSDSSRPRWWRDAAEDYLSKEAPAWMRILNRLWKVRDAQQLFGLPLAQSPRVGFEGNDQIRKLAGHFNEESGLDTNLYIASKGEEEIYILKVDDTDAAHAQRKVLSGVATRTGHLEREIILECNQGFPLGEVRISVEEVAAIGGLDNIDVIPAMEIFAD